MDDDARKQLAAQLEQQLTDFVDELSRNSSGYKDGWPEDRWEEEMDKHPFFMKQAPDLSSGELPPLLDGLAKLKFDPENNTDQELANNYKEDGNFYFKSKNYRLAVVSYTEGLKVKCDDDKLNATLYNNRSQSHYMLGNYRSGLKDCQEALALDPTYKKVRIRAAHCAFKLLEFKMCVEYCDRVLSDEKNKDAEKLRTESLRIIKDLEEKEDRDNRVLKLMKEKGIKIFNPTEDEDPELDLFLDDMPTIEKPARANADGTEIVWPVIILYPEYNIYDYYQEFVESRTVQNLMTEVLAVPPAWDEHCKYKSDAINIYYVGRSLSELHAVDPSRPMLDIMQEKTFYLRRMSPIFVVKPK